jgi:endonuclease YncB( thermonuclease family)
MSELLFGKDVELQAHTIDRHWRLVARVLVDGQDAGFELLKQGLCWVYERYLPEALAGHPDELPASSSCRPGAEVRSVE